jgi:hypothetical protein
LIYFIYLILLGESDYYTAFQNIITKDIGLANILNEMKELLELFFTVITTTMLLLPVLNSGRPYGWHMIFQVVRISHIGWAILFTKNLLVCFFVPSFFPMAFQN